MGTAGSDGSLHGCSRGTTMYASLDDASSNVRTRIGDESARKVGRVGRDEVAIVVAAMSRCGGIVFPVPVSDTSASAAAVQLELYRAAGPAGRARIAVG